MNRAGETEDKDGKLGGFYAYRNTFDENSIWVEVPKKSMQHRNCVACAEADGTRQSLSTM